MPSDCEDCGERPATECFENGAELCGPCAVERFKGQLSDAGRAAIAAPTGEAGVPWSSAMPFEWSDPGSPLTELRMWYDHAVLKAEAARRTGKYPLLLADKDRAFAAMLAAARVPAPSAAPVRPVEGPSFELPTEMLRMYDLAADKAVSVGALKMMHKAEAAIGRWYMKQRHAALSSEARDAD